MKTAAGVCWYMDHLIIRCLDSLQGHFDYIFVIDGKFTLNPAENDYSDPKLREKVAKYPNVIMVDYIGHEEDKRDQYLILCKKYDVDVLLIVDSDEYIEKRTDWDLFNSNLQGLSEGIYGIHMWPNDIHSPRLWVKPYNFRYYQAHCIFKHITTGDIIPTGDAGAIKVDGLTMQIGKDVPRTEEYLLNTRIYQGRMIEKEKEIRKAVHG